MKTIGFIGLGNMGLPMSLNLCRAGFPLLVCSSNPASSKKIEDAGGKSVSSFTELAQQADVVITIVPSDKEIYELYTASNGLINTMRNGTVCIDMTTANGSAKKAVEDYVKQKGKDIGVIDAPVSGGIKGAAEALLTIMVSCKKSLFGENMPIFSAMGKKIVYTGELGSASDIKMLNQMLNAGNNVLCCEALCMAKKLGVNLDIMKEIINESSGRSYIFKTHVPRFISGDHTPDFRLDLMKKDVGIFIEKARKHNTFTPIAEFVYKVFTACSNQGHGEKNVTYIFNWYEQNQ